MKRTIFTKKRFERESAGLVSTRANANINTMMKFHNGAYYSGDIVNQGNRSAGSNMTGAFFVSSSGAQPSAPSGGMLECNK